MNDAQKTTIFVEMYYAAVRAVCKNPFIKKPAKGSKKYEQLDKARQIVDELGGDYSDYIQVQFQAFRKMKGIFAPKPEHLISEGAIKRFQAWQMRKNKYTKEEYTVDGDTFIVTATRKSYPLHQVEADAINDMDATYAIVVSKMESYSSMGEDERRKALEAVEYLMAKLSYKHKTPLDSLRSARERLKT